MAEEFIPIVQKAYDFAVNLYLYVNRFPRAHKPLIGRELLSAAHRSSIASWLGLARHANAFKLSCKVFLEHDVQNIGKRLVIKRK